MPAGRVTMLFSDIESSTALVRSLGERYDRLLGDHFAIVRRAFDAHDGTEIRTEGDAIFAVFADATAAVTAAAEAQRQLQSHTWPDDGRIKVRMGLHTGDVRLSDGDYIGLAVHQAARVVNVAHGEQVVCSSTTASVVDVASDGIELFDLGAYRVRDFDAPEHLFQVRAEGLSDRFPALRAVRAEAHNLPAIRTAFVGRENEIVAVRKLVDEERVVSIVGPGGVGKTRLAIEVARREAERRVDGVVAVLMAPVLDHDLVAVQTAEALGVREEPGQPLVGTIAAALERRDFLLLLDNCEHVLDAVGEMVDAILERAPDVSVLATSREPLSLLGEAVYALRPLEVRVDDSSDEIAAGLECVRLFMDRATAIDRSFAAKADVMQVARICERVDGLPLAIELAAGRLRSMTAVDVERQLDDRLRLLSTTMRGLDPRQRSVRATIDWSYEMVTEGERTVISRLAMFPAGATLSAIEDVCPSSDVIDVIASLVDRSLVHLSADGRYSMLQTVREYALEKLRARDDTHDAYAGLVRWALANAQHEVALLDGTDAREAKTRLDSEHPNLLAALDHVLGEPGRSELAAEIGVALAPYWDHAGYWTTAADYLGRIPEARATGLRAKLAYRRGGFAELRGDGSNAKPLYLDAIDLASEAGDHETEAFAHLNLGGLHQMEADMDKGLDHFRRARDVAQASADELLVAFVDCQTMIVEMTAGEPDRLRSNAEAALAISRRHEDRSLEVQALMVLGSEAEWRAERRDECAEAVGWFEAALEVATALGSEGLQARVLLRLAHCHRMLRELDTARLRCEEGLDHAEHQGHRQIQAQLQAKLGNIAWAGGRYEEATTAYVDVLRLTREIGDRQLEAKTLHDLGWTAASAGDFERATGYFADGLATTRDSGWSARGSVFVLALGVLAAACGDYAMARELHAEEIDHLRANGLEGECGPHLLALGKVAHAEGDLMEARILFGRASDLGPSAGGAYAGAARARLALVLLDAEDHAEATRMIVDLLRSSGVSSFRDPPSDSDETELAWLALPALWIGASGSIAARPADAAVMVAAASRIERRGANGGPIWSMSAHDRERTARLATEVRERLEPDAFDELWAAGEREVDTIGLALRCLEQSVAL
jgi:predicted ATPase/class 3 adenylate cyclase